MTEREELLRRLERVKALAERGVGGEKENAEALLNRLMAKYGISEEDIEDTAERDYFIRYHNFWERKLIVQIAYKHLGNGHCCGTVGTQSGRPHKKICVTCTPAQYIEIETDFEFYKAAWEEELAIFYSAFISKNDIFPPPELASPSDLPAGMNTWPDCNPGDWFYLALQEATNSHAFQHKTGNYETWTGMNKKPDWTRYEH